MGAENRPFATDKGQSISYFCDTPMTIRKLSDDLIQIKEQKLPTCFSELFFGDGSSPDQTLRPPVGGGLFFCPISTTTAQRNRRLVLSGLWRREAAIVMRA
jgi:hypothetical protein